MHLRWSQGRVADAADTLRPRPRMTHRAPQHLTVLLLCLLAVTGRAGAQANRAAVLKGLFPAASQTPGWTVKEGPKLFTGDQVFDYMDGAGEIPRSYGLRQLASTKYGQGKNVLEVAIFDMGRAEDAFGYYSARAFLERNPRSKEKAVMLDHPARLSPDIGILTFWKGPYLVLVQPEIGKPDERTLLRFGKAVSARIREKGREPALLGKLPRQRMIPGTQRYVRGKPATDSTLIFLTKDLLGMSKGAEAAAAEYNLPGGTGTLALFQYPTSEACLAAYRAYGAYIKADARVLARLRAASGVTRKEKGTAVAPSGRYLLLVMGAKDAPSAEASIVLLTSGPRR